MLTAIVAMTLTVPPPSTVDMRPILDAIRQVETGGCKDAANAVGDNGRSIGPLQIQYGYWLDACEYEPSLRQAGYHAVRDVEYAERCVIAYLSRYVKDWSNPIDAAARTHNGGPKGIGRKATDGYAAKVKVEYSKAKKGNR
jgi:hypothetical protein